jgi:uncharacterized protein with NRDE domain
MCLVFIAYQTEGNPPVMIGANREESRRRPTTSPVCCRRGEVRCLIAGADHGPDGSFPEMGTWLGVNEAGLAVAVTNRADTELPWALQVRSRGLLAVELLGYASAEAALHRAESELSGPGYGGCNFLIAQARAAFVMQAPGARTVSVVRLESGTHAMTNLDLDDAADPRIRLVRAELDAVRFRSSAGRICRDERIVDPGDARGTICSSLIVAAGEILFYHIEGDPRRRGYAEFRLPARHSSASVSSTREETRS